jgi:hypothetical protein
MVTVMNKRKVLCSEERVKVIGQIQYKKNKVDMRWEFGLVDSMIRRIW